MFEADVLKCLECRGCMRILGFIHPPEAIREILDGFEPDDGSYRPDLASVSMVRPYPRPHGK